MKVIKIDEDSLHKGYCTMYCEFEQEEINILLEYAVNDILKKQIEKIKQDNKRRCFDCEEEIDEDTLYKYPHTEICIECMDVENTP
jgi:RNA polymerase-binding transcription factor DksA